MKISRAVILLLMTVMIVGSLSFPTRATSTQIFSTVLASRTGGGSQSSSHVVPPVMISGNGETVIFAAQGDDLSANDSNGQTDIYAKDIATGTLDLISINTLGSSSSVQTNQASVSDDGRFVAFASFADDLVDNDTNNKVDIFLRDRQAGTTTLVSVSTGGSQGNNHSQEPHISGDGRYIVFKSSATNLVTFPTLNTSESIFIYDTQTGDTELISISTTGTDSNGGSQLPSVSDDGNYVAFSSSSSNLIASDTNNANDLFVRNRSAGTTQRVSLDKNNNELIYCGCIQSKISGDGNVVAFTTGEALAATDTNSKSDAYVRDISEGSTELVSQNSGILGNDNSSGTDISDDGRFVVFLSSATNLVSEDTNSTSDILVADRLHDSVTRVNLSDSGAQANGVSHSATISDSGLKIAYASQATNLVVSDTNGMQDVFITTLQPEDDLPPIIGTTEWQANPVTVGTDTSFFTTVIDDASGVAAGEYFIGNDPGIGSGTVLSWDGNNLNSDLFGANLEPGVYDIGIRAQDNAGNWSATQTEYLVVFDPAGPGYIVGQQKVTPGAGDTLPWISTDSKDFATFGFNVEFTDTGTVDPSSEFSFSYVEKGNCNSPNTPDCRTFILSTASFNWLAIGGTANSEGTFQGSGNLDVDGVISEVTFRIEAIDGNQLTPSVNDSFELNIWPASSSLQNPSLYQVSADFSPGTGNANGAIQIKN